MARPLQADSDNAVSKVIQISRALYICVPQNIARRIGLKQGDRVAMETNNQHVIFTKIPFAELVNRALLCARGKAAGGGGK